MQISIYAKKRTMNNGKVFYNYLSRLTSRQGEVVPVNVKFPEGSEPDPARCPMNVVFNKCDANLSWQRYENKKGEEAISHTLWVKVWEEGEPFVDTSLDDFDY